MIAQLKIAEEAFPFQKSRGERGRRPLTFLLSQLEHRKGGLPQGSPDQENRIETWGGEDRTRSIRLRNK